MGQNWILFNDCVSYISNKYFMYLLNTIDIRGFLWFERNLQSVFALVFCDDMTAQVFLKSSETWLRLLGKRSKNCTNNVRRCNNKNCISCPLFWSTLNSQKNLHKTAFAITHVFSRLHHTLFENYRKGRNWILAFSNKFRPS